LIHFYKSIRESLLRVSGLVTSEGLHARPETWVVTSRDILRVTSNLGTSDISDITTALARGKHRVRSG